MKNFKKAKEDLLHIKEELKEMLPNNAKGTIELKRNLSVAVEFLSEHYGLKQHERNLLLIETC